MSAAPGQNKAARSTSNGSSAAHKDPGHAARRAAIRGLIRARQVRTQQELRSLLTREGFEVTQGTLSRDLARLGARRVSLPQGGTAYELDDLQALDGADTLGHLRELVTAVEEGQTLVVVHTLPGAASAVALAIDRARLSGVIGTLAGDDTIFVASSRGVTPAKVSRRLKSLWLAGGLTS